MAAKPITQSRVVRFFEAVDHRSGLPFEHELPWDRALIALSHSDVTPEDRTVNHAGDDHHGGPWMGTPNMLLLSRIRAGIDVPEIFDRANGELEALELAETQGIAETSHVAFFPANIIGMIRTTNTPGAGSLGTWLSKMDLFDGIEDPIDVIPLSRVSIESKLADAERANGVKIRARSTATQAMRAAGAPRLADSVDMLTETFGPVTVEMRVYVTAGQPAFEVRDTIMDEARGLAALTADGQAVEGLEGASLMYRSLERERTEEVNMLKDKFAERVEVEMVDGEGKSTRRASAADAMLRAYNHLEADLRAAVERER